MLDYSSITVSVLAHVIFRYHLPLRFLSRLKTTRSENHQKNPAPLKCVHAWFFVRHDQNYENKRFFVMFFTVFFGPGFNCQSEANIPLVIVKYTSKSAIYLRLDKKQATIVMGRGGGGAHSLDQEQNQFLPSSKH
jgi:hypothetical protein